MAYTSPLFQSSFDLFSHSIEHFNLGTERDRKFVILHLANAVELIMKDLMLDLGLSIYKNPKETITITGAIENLSKEKGIKIPHLNKLELLIDERNALQHRYGFPNELTTIFYMDATYDFFKEFLSQNYSLDIEKVIEDFLKDADLMAFRLRSVTTHTELEKLNFLTKVHPVGALLSAHAYLEKKIHEIRGLIFSNIEGEQPELRRRLITLFSTDGLVRLFHEYGMDTDQSIRQKLTEFRNARNQVAHGRDTIASKDVIEFIELVKGLEPKIEELNKKVISEPKLLINKEQERIKRINEVVAIEFGIPNPNTAD